MNEHHHHHADAGVSAGNKVRDPVCGMMVDPAKAAAKFDYQGKTYYFCNPGCLKKFQANPDVYLSTVRWRVDLNWPCCNRVILRAHHW